MTSILEQFESWSEQTYEGRRVAAAVGIDQNSSAVTNVQISDVYKQPFGMVLASGVDSLSFLITLVLAYRSDRGPLGKQPTQ